MHLDGVAPCAPPDHLPDVRRRALVCGLLGYRVLVRQARHQRGRDDRAAPTPSVQLAQGRDVELEEIWGEPVRRAKAIGAPVPRMEMLYWLIKQRLAARKLKAKTKR